MTKTQNIGVGQKRNLISPFGYRNGHSFVKGMAKQSAGDYTSPSYFRSGFPELGEFEEKIAQLIGVPKEELYFMSSGMSAVVAALEITSPSRDDIVIHGTAEYSKTDVYIEEDLKERGVKSFTVNPGDIDKVDKLLKNLVKDNTRSAVKAIYFETVGNGPEMPVLDVGAFLKLESLRKLDTLIIIDNTFPTNSVLKLSEFIKDNQDLKIVGIESATKFYLNNQDLGGIVFTPNEEIRKKLLLKRTRAGFTPSISLVEKFSGIASSKAQFDNDNKLIMNNTYLLAQACKQSSSADKFFVGYPNLSDHPNYNYVSKNYPMGIAPVFFLKPQPKTNMTAEEMFYRLENAGAFSEMEITESFAFGSSAVSHNTRYGSYIRMAGGLESKKEILLKAKRLQKALETI